MKYVCIALLSILLSAISQALLKLVAMAADTPVAVFRDFRLYAGGAVLILAFVAWMIAASRMEFSRLIPMHAFTIVLGGIIGAWLFGETITKPTLLAYGFILAGVAILGLTAVNN